MIASRKSLRHHFRADKEPPMIGPGIEGDYFDNQNEEFLMQKLNVVQRYYPKKGKGQNQKISTPPPLLPKFKSGYQSESTIDTSEMDDEDSEKFLYSLFTEKDKQEKEQEHVYDAEGLVKTMNNDGNIDGNINRDTDRNVNGKNTNQHHEIMNTTTVWEQRPNEEASSSVNKSQLQSSSYHPQKVLLEAQLPRPHKSPNCSSASIDPGDESEITRENDSPTTVRTTYTSKTVKRGSLTTGTNVAAATTATGAVNKVHDVHSDPNQDTPSSNLAPGKASAPAQGSPAGSPPGPSQQLRSRLQELLKKKGGTAAKQQKVQQKQQQQQKEHRQQQRQKIALQLEHFSSHYDDSGSDHSNDLEVTNNLQQTPKEQSQLHPQSQQQQQQSRTSPLQQKMQQKQQQLQKKQRQQQRQKIALQLQQFESHYDEDGNDNSNDHDEDGDPEVTITLQQTPKVQSHPQSQQQQQQQTPEFKEQVEVETKVEHQQLQQPETSKLLTIDPSPSAQNDTIKYETIRFRSSASFSSSIHDAVEVEYNDGAFGNDNDDQDIQQPQQEQQDYIEITLPQHQTIMFKRSSSFSSSIHDEFEDLDDLDEGFVEAEKELINDYHNQQQQMKPSSKRNVTKSQPRPMLPRHPSTQYSTVSRSQRNILNQLQNADELQDFARINNFTNQGDILLSKIVRERARIQMKKEMLQQNEVEMYVAVHKSSETKKADPVRDNKPEERKMLFYC